MANEIRKVVINVSAKDFEVKCSQDFAEFLQADIALLSGGTNKVELKKFVVAYVTKSYEHYKFTKQIDKLTEKLIEIMDKKAQKETPFEVGDGS